MDAQIANTFAAHLDFEALVRRYQRPFYGLACRMLGNEADAADAVQEIFAAVFRRFRTLDPDRKDEPWLYRIAIHCVLNFARGRSRRRRHEKESPMLRRDSSGGGPEKKDLEGFVAARVRELPDELRAVVALRFWGDLTQEEIAAALEIPRTTAKARLDRALIALRRTTSGAGYAASIVGIEEALAAPVAPPVPPGLTESLLEMAHLMSAPATGGAVGALGGMIVTKSLMVTVGLAAAGSLIAGILVGKSFGGSGDADLGSPHNGDSGQVPLARFADLERRHAEAVERTRRLDAEADAAKKRAAALEIEMAAVRRSAGEARERTTAALDGAAPESSPARTPGAKGRLDWTRFGELFADAVGILGRTGGDPGKMTDEQRALMEAMTLETARLTAEARALSDYPYFHPDVLGGAINGLYGRSLGLDGDQSKAVSELVQAALAKTASGLDPKTALPVEVYKARCALNAAIDDGLDDIVNADQRERWESARRITAGQMRGPEALATFGIDAGGEGSSLVDSVVSHWSDAYDFNPGQRSSAEEGARRLLRDARTILARYGQEGDSPRRLAPAEAAAMDDEFLALQAAVERGFDPLLTGEQRSALRRRPPHLIRFRSGRNANIDVRRSPGF